MGCKECGSKYVVNKWFKLCQGCNNIRLHGNQYGKSIENKEQKIKPPKSHLNKRVVDKGEILHVSGGRRTGKNFKLDELLYEEVFNNSDHKCEECGKQLPTKFRDEDGKIIARFRYSHIIPKSIASEIRHYVGNINNLCMEHHHMWDFGNKTEMKIYSKNQLKFPNYLKPIS